MKRALMAAGVLLLFFSAPAFAGGAEEKTTGTFLEEMISLEWLARSMPPGTRMIQFSSYDRASKVVDGETVGLGPAPESVTLATPSPALGWWANRDLGKYLREEKTERGVEYVMAEAQGPGVIVRMWSANPGGRIWRIYIDGGAEPVIEAAGKDLLGGRVKPWREPFAGRRNLGANFIFPLAFSKCVKVTVSKRSGRGGRPPLMYYQVDFRLYPESVRVRSFSWEELKELEPLLAKAAKVLSAPEEMPLAQAPEQAVEAGIAPGGEGELFELTGPAGLVYFEVQVLADDDSLSELLARSLLVMEWDQQGPAVMAPLGDFFGSSPGANEFSSLPFTVKRTDQGVKLVSRWVMPFQEKAVIKVKNQAGIPLRLQARVRVRPGRWEEDSLYFHADWREWNKMETRPFHDLPVVAVSGQGHFVGLEMNVRNPMEYFWWGEGDEKVWVDGEDFPSIFGTGTEDYFGYAWCFQYVKFTHAYHGVSLPTKEWLVVPQAVPVPYFWEWLSKTTAHAAVVSQYRWQILDTIPFDQELRFYMELWHHRHTTVDINTVAYWYAAAGAKDDSQPENLSRRQVWEP